MSQKLSLKDLDLKGKKVLMRVDYNVPMNKEGEITDDTRIRSTLFSIEYILDQGASIILMSHLGRPKDQFDSKLSLKPCAIRLSELLKKPVVMAGLPNCDDTKKKIENLMPGQIVLLENLRFNQAEENPDLDASFTKTLASFADVYVNDAFAAAHRKHASTYSVPALFKDKAAAGMLMETELNFLSKVLALPERPFVAIVGGSKVSSKIGVLKALLKKADALLIGGAMAYTFMRAKGLDIGDSLYEDDFLKTAKEILAMEKQGNCHIYLPVDHVIAKNGDANQEIRIVTSQEGIPAGFKGMDIGPATIDLFYKSIKGVKTIFWNGPMGVFEEDRFANGTKAVAQMLSKSTAVTIVGGGDSVAAVKMAGVQDRMSHISTGGGATLELIEYGTLPGVEVLTSKSRSA